MLSVTSSYNCIILAWLDSSPRLSNMLCAEVNTRIPNCLVIFRWNALFAKDFSKYLTSLLICCVPDRTLLPAAETQCSLRFCCSIFEFYTCVYTAVDCCQFCGFLCSLDRIISQRGFLLEELLFILFKCTLCLYTSLVISKFILLKVFLWVQGWYGLHSPCL